MEATASHPPPDRDVPAAFGDSHPRDSLDTARLIRFLNGLSTAREIHVAGSALNSALAELLGDVDRVTVMPDLARIPDRQGSAPRELLVVTDLTEGESTEEVGVTVEGAPTDRTGILLAELRAQGRPIDQYHRPDAIELVADGEYIGTILLWRDRDKSPTPAPVLALARSLAPFLAHVVDGMVARHHLVHAGASGFYASLEDVLNGYGLTAQEQRATTLQLFGRSYREIAQTMGIAENTVKQHLRHAHAKAGVDSLAQLVGRLIAPRVYGTQCSEAESREE